MMPERLLRSALLTALLVSLVLTGCSRPAFLRKKADVPELLPAADAATANATTFSVTLVETDIQKRATVASGTVTLNAPLARATSGTWSMTGSPSRSLLHAGKEVATSFQSLRTGTLEIGHSGALTILTFLDKEGTPITKIMGAPHGNAIQDHWYHLGTDAGLATVTPRP